MKRTVLDYGTILHRRSPLGLYVIPFIALTAAIALVLWRVFDWWLYTQEIGQPPKRYIELPLAVQLGVSAVVGLMSATVLLLLAHWFRTRLNRQDCDVKSY